MKNLNIKTKKNIESLEENIAAVYFLLDSNKCLVYVGNTKDLKRRLKQHIQNVNKLRKSFKDKKEIYSIPAKPYTYFAYVNVRDNSERDRLERAIISEFGPKYNNTVMQGFRDNRIRIFETVITPPEILKKLKD